jgi:hypothetical protein
VKFLCIGCDHVMDFAERQLPGDGTMAAVFKCERCRHEVALLTNPMETRLVSGLGVRVGGRTVPDQPMELLRSTLADGREGAFEHADEATAAGEAASDDETAAPATDASAPVGEAGYAPPPARGPVSWSPAARERLGVVPSFVRGMVKRIYTEWAWEQGISEMTPETMDRARTELGMEGM